MPRPRFTARDPDAPRPWEMTPTQDDLDYTARHLEQQARWVERKGRGCPGEEKGYALDAFRIRQIIPLLRAGKVEKARAAFARMDTLVRDWAVSGTEADGGKSRETPLSIALGVEFVQHEPDEDRSSGGLDEARAQVESWLRPLSQFDTGLGRCVDARVAPATRLFGLELGTRLVFTHVWEQGDPKSNMEGSVVSLKRVMREIGLKPKPKFGAVTRRISSARRVTFETEIALDPTVKLNPAHLGSRSAGGIGIDEAKLPHEVTPTRAEMLRAAAHLFRKSEEREKEYRLIWPRRDALRKDAQVINNIAYYLHAGALNPSRDLFWRMDTEARDFALEGCPQLLAAKVLGVKFFKPDASEREFMDRSAGGLAEAAGKVLSLPLNLFPEPRPVSAELDTRTYEFAILRLNFEPAQDLSERDVRSLVDDLGLVWRKPVGVNIAHTGRAGYDVPFIHAIKTFVSVALDKPSTRVIRDLQAGHSAQRTAGGLGEAKSDQDDRCAGGEPSWGEQVYATATRLEKAQRAVRWGGGFVHEQAVAKAQAELDALMRAFRHDPGRGLDTVDESVRLLLT